MRFRVDYNSLHVSQMSIVTPRVVGMGFVKMHPIRPAIVTLFYKANLITGINSGHVWGHPTFDLDTGCQFELVGASTPMPRQSFKVLPKSEYIAFLKSQGTGSRQAKGHSRVMSP